MGYRWEQPADDPKSFLDHMDEDPEWLRNAVAESKARDDLFTEDEFPPTKTWHVVLAVVGGLVLGCVIGALAWVAFEGLLS